MSHFTFVVPSACMPLPIRRRVFGRLGGLAVASVLITGCVQDVDDGTAWQPNLAPVEESTGEAAPTEESTTEESPTEESTTEESPTEESPTEESTTEESTTEESTTEESTGKPEAAAAPITLESGTWDDVQACVAESAGKVVVIDLWSTSCLPCIKELPQLGRLQQDHSDDVVCVSLSLEYVGIKSKPPEFYRERVEQVLEKCGANVRNFLCTTEAEEVFGALELASIPAVYVYGTDGELVQRFDSSSMSGDSQGEEPFTYETDIMPLVERLIASAK